MSLFKKRPQLAQLEFISPPSTEALHAYPEEHLPASQRAAKRRRIEDYAKDVLKGRDVFISTASLKGPFDNGWRNPWKRKTSGPQVETAPAQHEAADIHENVAGNIREEQDVEGAIVPETEARPASRAGSDYCQDWLRRQKFDRYTPDLDDEFDTEIRDGDEVTPSRCVPHKRRSSVSGRQKPGRPNVLPPWTADHPERVTLHSDVPDQHGKFNSLQVNMDSSVAKRSVSEQPRRGPHPGMFGTRDAIVDDTTMTKVSLIRDDTPQTRRGPLVRLQGPQGEDVDSPGFVFRRVGDGKRPFSRGSNKSKPSTTEPDEESHVWVSVADVHGCVQPESVAEEPEFEDEVEEESVTIYANDKGKWPCPMSECSKRPKPYSSRSGIRGHLKNKHGEHHTKTASSRVLAHLRHTTAEAVPTAKDIAVSVPEHHTGQLTLMTGAKVPAEEVPEAAAGLEATTAADADEIVTTTVIQPVISAHHHSALSAAIVMDVMSTTTEVSKQHDPQDVIAKGEVDAPAGHPNKKAIPVEVEEAQSRETHEM
jgi:hypothetical protein